MTVIKPYGAWASPISASRLAQGAISVSDLRADSGALHWIETRPAEGGRQVMMSWRNGDAARELTPKGFNARTRVHEYGGAPFVVAGETVLFANYADQRLYLQRGGSAPEPLTSPPFRYADLAPLPSGGFVGVREDHNNPAEARNAIVRLSGEAGDDGAVLFDGADFVAWPRPSPDGRRIAFIAWDHPNMPWDDTRLLAAELSPGGLANVRTVAGGPGESVIQPQWDEAGRLFFLSDRTGFWNLYRSDAEAAVPLLTKDAEFAGPAWMLGFSDYALMRGGRVLARYFGKSGHRLVLIGPPGEAREIPLPFTVIGAITRLDEDRAAFIAASAGETAAVVVLDVETGEARIVRRPSPAGLDAGFISRPEAITFPTAGGAVAHALYYPPTNRDFAPPPGERPPLIVQVHGGPTSQRLGALSLADQYWTSRGLALVDVNYRGSSGYGRAYRKALEGVWGIADIQDAVAAVRFIVGEELADPARVAIHGGSAGGFTVIAALSQGERFGEVFAAGASYFGVADLGALARETHKFESRYLDGLVGPWPAAKAVYDARSPLSHLEGFHAPLLIFQGSDDPVVPPNQAHMIRDALMDRGRPFAYMEFAGESHGFRKAETIIACHEAELSFYAQVFGFAPVDPVAAVKIAELVLAMVIAVHDLVVVTRNERDFRYFAVRTLDPWR